MSTKSLTRVERILSIGNFGAGVIVGLNGTDRPAVKLARDIQAELRFKAGYANAPATILTSGAAQYKLGKNSLASFGLMLTPERGMMRPDIADIRDAFGIAGPINICPLASDGCSFACLVTSGQSGMPTAQRAQAARTAFLLARPYESGLIIGAEIRAALKRNSAINLRLNTTSDIRWELVAPDMMRALSNAGVKLYDYTAWSPGSRDTDNFDYHLTYSAKETSHTSDEYLESILASGRNVAIPFDTPRGAALPASWHGYRVIDGDESDERRHDPAGVVVGLRAKGHAWKRDNSSGFIRAARG